jgi:hypothetical protein
MAIRYEMPSGGVRLKTAQGEGEIWMATPSIAMYATYGYVSTDLTNRLVAGLNRLTHGVPSFYFFINAANTTGYDPGARVAMTEWIKRNGPRLIAFHVLVQSKLLSMAAAVANLATGGIIRSHSNLAAFEAELIAAGGGRVVHARRAARSKS